MNDVFPILTKIQVLADIAVKMHSDTVENNQNSANRLRDQRLVDSFGNRDGIVRIASV